MVFRVRKQGKNSKEFIMSQMRCKNCGQFANIRHACLDTAPKTVTIPRGSHRVKPQDLISKNLMKKHEVVACLRLMSTAVGNPIEGGRSDFAQKQARIVLEQKFGKIDWNS